MKRIDSSGFVSFVPLCETSIKMPMKELGDQFPLPMRLDLATATLKSIRVKFGGSIAAARGIGGSGHLYGHCEHQGAVNRIHLRTKEGFQK